MEKTNNYYNIIINYLNYFNFIYEGNSYLLYSIFLPPVFLNYPFKPNKSKWSKWNESFWPYTYCTSIVPIEKSYILGNTLGLPRLTQFLRNITYINSYFLGLMIGVILGGGHLSLTNNTTSPRLIFNQSIINFPFFWNVYINLIHYIPSIPRFGINSVKGINYYYTAFQTRNYPIFIFLYNLFYTDSIKTISPELIHYFTPVSLAYWIMSDGVSNKYALTLCTDRFTIQEVVLLINILIIKYDLNCSIHKSNNNLRIYIKAESIDKLHKLVDPYIIPFSAYKLKNEKRFNI